MNACDPLLKFAFVMNIIGAVALVAAVALAFIIWLGLNSHSEKGR